jgi:methionyl-tRNA formyltransferase
MAVERIGLLCVKNDPLIKVFTSKLLREKNKEFHFIFDDIGFSDLDLDIINSRVDRSFIGKSLYNQFFDKRLEECHKFFNFSHNSNETIEYIKINQIDVLLNIGTTKKLKKEVIEATKYGIINIHPGNLPDYRGSCAVEWAIYNFDPIFLSAHFMALNYDAGPIITKQFLKLKCGDTYRVLRTKVYIQTADIFQKVVNLLSKAEFKSHPQIEERSRYFQPISSKDLEIVNYNLESYLKMYYDD